MNPAETTPALAPVEASLRIESAPPSRWSRFAWGGLKWVVGGLLSTFLVFSVIVVGWTARAARREALKTWWRRSPARLRGESFRDFTAAQSATEEFTDWPNWLLGPRTRSESHTFRLRIRRIAGGLVRNLRVGIPMAFNTGVLTLPSGLLWSVAWFAGWQNSFNKGYEHAWFGPTVFILGMLFFTATMAYLPWAQARQASTADWRRFYDFRLLGRLIRKHWLASVGLAVVWAAACGAVLLMKLMPPLAQYVPELTDLSAPEALKVSHRFFALMALGLFPLYVAIRLLAARIYAQALCTAYQTGGITEDELGEAEWHALRRLELLTPQPRPERKWFLRLARWLATRTGQITAAASLFLIWFGLSFLVVVSEFVAKTELGRGWWNQPMIQLPWFDYTPNRLREAAKAAEGQDRTPLSPPAQASEPKSAAP